MKFVYGLVSRGSRFSAKCNPIHQQNSKYPQIIVQYQRIKLVPECTPASILRVCRVEDAIDAEWNLSVAWEQGMQM